LSEETIIGCVIEGDKDFFLTAGGFWQKSPISDAHVHTPTEVERLRGAFLHRKNPPKCMYLVRHANGKPVIDKRPISFYLASCGIASDDEHFVGDCIQFMS